jgi:hypothetical protein
MALAKRFASARCSNFNPQGYQLEDAFVLIDDFWFFLCLIKCDNDARAQELQ